MYNDRKNTPPQGRGGGFNRPPADAGYKPTDSELNQIIVTGDAVKLNEVADKLGKDYSGGLTTSQIRNFYDRVLRITTYNINQVQLLRPLLAYAAGRHKGKVRQLQEVLDKSIGFINSQETFSNFKNFFEAIVAYHRYHGGREN